MKAYLQIQFREACSGGNLTKVKELMAIEDGVNPSAHENAAIIHACERGHFKIVEYLLQLPLHLGVDPAVTDNLLLKTACRNGNVQIVDLLLKEPASRGVDPAVDDNEPMRRAAAFNHVQVVDRLLQEPVERGVVISNLMQYPPFDLIVAHQSWDVVCRLLQEPEERGFDAAVDENFLLKRACQNGQFKAVDILLNLPTSRGVDPAVNDNYPLRAACDRGFYEIAQRLLQEKGRGVNARALDNMCLKSASRGGHLRIVNLLLEQGDVDPCDGKHEALEAALYFHRYDVVNRLLEDGRVAASALDLQLIVAGDRLYLSSKGNFQWRHILLFQDGSDPEAFSEETLTRWANIPNIKRHLEQRNCFPYVSQRARKLLEQLREREHRYNILLMAPYMPSNDALNIVREYANLEPFTDSERVKRAYKFADSEEYKVKRLRSRK